MKLTKNVDCEQLQAMLENLELPEVRMPASKQRLNETLLASGCFEREVAFRSLQQKNRARFFNFKPATWKLVASLAVLFLALTTYKTFFIAPQAVASLVVQVNPAFTMVISARNNVISAEGLDVQGKALLAGLDLTGLDVREALLIIADALREAGLLSPERRILIALHPVGDKLGTADLAVLSGNVRQTVDEYLTGHGLSLEVVNSELTAEFMDVANEAGLLPADYLDLVAAFGYPAAGQLLNLYRELGLNPARFKEEFVDIAERMTDLIEEEGLSEKEALTIIRMAIKADPTLENFDDLSEPLEKETGEEVGYKSGRPDYNVSGPDALDEAAEGAGEPGRPKLDESRPDAPREEKNETQEDGGLLDDELQEPVDDAEGQESGGIQ